MRLDARSNREILKANFEEYQQASKKGRKELPKTSTALTDGTC
jgi:hypothetical protein